jgi:hypothetical protein
LKFDDSGTASLAGWKSKSDFGKPSFSEPKDQGPKGSLVVTTESGSSIGSWRASAWLERGHYRIQGKVKTRGIVADPGDPRGGAGLRTGNARPQQYLTGDSDWKTVESEFEVPEPLNEVQVVCEFRGEEGEAWFDLDSIHIKRVENK